MKTQHLIFFVLLFNCQFLTAQNPTFEPVQFNVFSEFTTTTKDLAYRWGDKSQSIGIGFGAGVDFKYRIKPRFYLIGGGSLVQRRFKTTVFLNQWALFPEGTALPKILLALQKFSYQILEIDVGAGFNVLQNEKIDLSIYGKAGVYGVISGNYPADFRDYGGLYGKGDVFGKMIVVGTEAKWPLFENWFGLLGVEYSLINKIGRDDFLYSQDEYDIRVPHQFYRLSLGLQKRF